MAMANIQRNQDHERGWQIGLPLSSCNKHMLEREICCDVTFAFPAQEDGTNNGFIYVRAHKYMLVSRSPVFEAMLCGDFKEASNIITITDIEPQVFKEFLRFLYCDDARVTADNVLHLMSVAKKYILEGLVERTRSFLEKELDQNNVCTILTHCLLYDENDLVKKCIDYISYHAAKVFESDDFFELSRHALYSLLSENRVGLHREADFFKLCIQWAEKKHLKELVLKQDSIETMSDDAAALMIGELMTERRSNIPKPRYEIRPEASNEVETVGNVVGQQLRDILGPCMFQIRFISMTAADFAGIAGETEVLTDKEKLMIYAYLATSMNETQLKSHGFNIEPRDIPKAPETFICQRFATSSVSDGRTWGYTRQGKCDAIDFKVSDPINICGVTLYGGRRPEQKHTIKLQLFDGMQEKWLDEYESEIEQDKCGNDYTVSVKMDPLLVKPGVVYSIKATISGPGTYFGKGGLGPVTTETGVKFEFLYSDESTNGTTVFEGQIPGIIYQPIT